VNPAYLEAALTAGGMGYVLKSGAREELLKAIQSVLSGSIYVTPGLSSEHLERFKDPSSAAARACERFFAAALLVAFLLELLLQRPAGGGENAEQYRICVNQRIRAGQHARLCAVLKSARTGQRAMPGFVGATRSGAVQRVSPLNSMVP